MAIVVGLHASNGGVPKLPVSTLLVTADGCDGDSQNDLKHHGGKDKAVCILQQEIIDKLSDKGHPIGPGTTGENLLINGIQVGMLSVGTRLKIGHCELEITQDAPPCKTIKQSFNDDNFMLISHKKYPNFTRWYAKVISEGEIILGQEVNLTNSL